MQAIAYCDSANGEIQMAHIAWRADQRRGLPAPAKLSRLTEAICLKRRSLLSRVSNGQD